MISTQQTARPKKPRVQRIEFLRVMFFVPNGPDEEHRVCDFGPHYDSGFDLNILPSRMSRWQREAVQRGAGYERNRERGMAEAHRLAVERAAKLTPPPTGYEVCDGSLTLDFSWDYDCGCWRETEVEDMADGTNFHL